MCISEGDTIAAIKLPSGEGMARVKAIPLQSADGVRQTIMMRFTGPQNRLCSDVRVLAKSSLAGIVGGHLLSGLT
jgi:hypothetical protein